MHSLIKPGNIVRFCQGLLILFVLTRIKNSLIFLQKHLTALISKWYHFKIHRLQPIFFRFEKSSCSTECGSSRYSLWRSDLQIRCMARSEHLNHPFLMQIWKRSLEHGEARSLVNWKSSFIFMHLQNQAIHGTVSLMFLPRVSKVLIWRKL